MRQLVLSRDRVIYFFNGFYDSPSNFGLKQIESPPSLLQVMFGVGNPDAAHCIETLPPSLTTISVLVG